MVSAVARRGSRVRALQAGAEDVFWKPFEDVMLLARLRAILRAREAERELGLRHMTYRELGFAEPAAGFERPATVVLINDGSGSRPAAGPEICRARSGATGADPDARSRPDRSGRPPDRPMSSSCAPGPHRTGEGLRLLSELRSRRSTRFASVCVVVPPDALDLAAMALDLGANDLIETEVDGRGDACCACRVRSAASGSPTACALRLRTGCDWP